LKMEGVLSRAVENGWGITDIAREAGVCRTTAAKFLRTKVDALTATSTARITGFSSRAGAAFSGAAARQIRRLESLAGIDEDKWTPADYALEKHTMAMLKPLMEWTRPTGAVSESSSPQLSDGL